MNHKEDLIISGGINHITIWEYNSIWKIKQIITVEGHVHSINLNPSESILISVVQPSYRYFIHIYELQISNIWRQKQCIEVGFNIRENICFLQDDIFIANTIGLKIVDILFEYQNDIIEFYKQNKNGLFQKQKQQYTGKEWIQTSNFYNNQYSTSRKLIFCQFQSIIAGYSHKCIKFIKIQDQAKFTMIQTIKFDGKFQNLELSQDLKYIFITRGNLIKIFEFKQIQ